ncbi:FKBP-type peptidyl-prolyl cis-trans isomerase [Streptomyces sp. RFCAC02]|uniref:FKBP-type peptidyl-prolyl cis-trans isomerase n=1 Tax=Streptomyces sp. RFCAC02 TaxID=2499143 RepID=UPI001F0EE183|nr:FKBP-type peptidyl-prolyl cis-trans isomerase [Streptomyces sp. RFCAC02]
MTPTKRVGRIAAALTVPALLLPLAACGDSEPSGPVATVSGDAGEQPEIDIDSKQVGSDVVSEVLSEGDGAEVGKGDYLRLDVLARTTSDNEDLVNTWSAGTGEESTGGDNAEGDDEESADTPRQQVTAQAGEDSLLLATVTEPLVGTHVGSRVMVQGRATDMIGQAAQQMGLDEDEGVVWVIDVVAASSVDPTSRVEGEQAPPDEGMPTVEADAAEAATITIPEGEDPPEELRDQVLIQGEGPEVESGQALVIQYTGVTWADGEMFDSSWERDAASAFQIGTGQVVQGWDQGLVGKHVGDRVLLVIPRTSGTGTRTPARSPQAPHWCSSSTSSASHDGTPPGVPRHLRASAQE